MKNNAKNKERHYAAWQRSGLSKKAYAIQHGLSVSSFYCWSAKFEQQSSSGNTEFELIEVESVESNTPMAVIHFANGTSLEWHGSAEAIVHLKKLIH